MSKPKATATEIKMRADPAFRKGLKKIDRAKLGGLVKSLEIGLVPGIAFHNIVEHATELKAKTRRLDRASDKQIVQAGRQAAHACRRAVHTMDQVARMFARSGMDDVAERHIPAVFRHFDKDPKIQAGLNKLRRLGVHEDAIKCVRGELAKVKFNPLRLRGANGTISGLVEKGGAGVPNLEHFVSVVRKHGLPTIRGASSDTAAAVVTTIIIIGAVIIIVSWFV